MATQKQIDANRRNALRSTGPRSEAGKSASRVNALRHGLTAQLLTLPYENPAEFEVLRDAIHDEFSPRDASAFVLADTLAKTLWRLRRVPVFEGILLTSVGTTFKNPAWPERGARTVFEVNHAESLKGPMLGYDGFGKISRYEAHLLRQVEFLMSKLSSGRGESDVAPSEPGVAHNDAVVPAEERCAGNSPGPTSIEIDWSALLRALAASCVKGRQPTNPRTIVSPL